MVEIERKFLLSGFPDLPVLECSEMEQGYLCTCPVVRIRKKTVDGKAGFRLCFKGKGTLAREEIELPIEADVYERLKTLLPMPPVKKIQKIYSLPGGLKLECNLVDAGTPAAFYYAEVEFQSVEQARAFVPPDFLLQDVTEQPGCSMSSYWMRKLNDKQGENVDEH